MAKGDSTGASTPPNPSMGSQPNLYGGMGGINGQPNLPPMYNVGGVNGGQQGGPVTYNPQGQGGGGGQQGGGQQNPLFQGMDPRLVQLFQHYGVNPTGTGTGNSDIGYWNSKIGAQGADADYYLNRLGSDFAGNGPDMANQGNVTYGGQQGNLAQRYYQQPMQQQFGRQGAQGRFGFRPQGYGGGQGGYNTGYTGSQWGGNVLGQGSYPANNSSRWGYSQPSFNPNTQGLPTPGKDTSENPQ